MIRLVDGPFDPGAATTAFCRGRLATGAVASFVGLARGERADAVVLELDCYPGFTEARLAEAADEATRRFGLQDVSIIHRIGEVRAGEAIVMVLTAATHRREAFEACDFLMDYLKSSAPLWKKDHSAGAPRWVEPTARDRRDAERWVTPCKSGETP